MSRTDLDFGVVRNPSALDQELVELVEKYLWLDIAENSILPSSMSSSPPPTDPEGLAEMMDSFRAEIRDPSSIPIPSGSAEQEEYRGFESLVEGNNELKNMFFEWSMKNRDHISPEQIKAIKFRQSTIERATNSFGHDIESKKKLLKALFLWVECCQSRSYQNPNPSPSPSPYLGASSQVYSGNHQQFVIGIPLYPLFGQHNPYVPNNGNITNPQFQAVLNGESSLGRFPASARKRRMELLRLKREGIDGVQPAMGKREMMQFQISAFQRMLGLGYKFLLQKVLVQSDIGGPGGGRIVLPKRGAERHLPKLQSGDRINIEIEEVGTSQVWSMRYRFWHNNVSSRMYVLENTGEYVRANGLQVGDIIVMYLDKKRKKYMIKSFNDRQAATTRQTGNVSAAAGTSGNSSSSLVC